MGWVEASLILFGGLVAVMGLGLPVAFTFLALNIVGAWLFLGGEPNDVGGRLEQPGDARRHEQQQHVDAHMLAPAQEPRCGEQRGEIERVFGDLVRPGKADPQRVAQDDVGGGERHHGEQQQRRQRGQRCEQAFTRLGQSVHVRRL